jgi:hypothetical protein
MGLNDKGRPDAELLTSYPVTTKMNRASFNESAAIPPRTRDHLISNQHCAAGPEPVDPGRSDFG